MYWRKVPRSPQILVSGNPFFPHNCIRVPVSLNTWSGFPFLPKYCGSRLSLINCVWIPISPQLIVSGLAFLPNNSVKVPYIPKLCLRVPLPSQIAVPGFLCPLNAVPGFLCSLNAVPEFPFLPKKLFFRQMTDSGKSAQQHTVFKI
jgi:hypothetical protein